MSREVRLLYKRLEKTVERIRRREKAAGNPLEPAVIAVAMDPGAGSMAAAKLVDTVRRTQEKLDDLVRDGTAKVRHPIIVVLDVVGRVGPLNDSQGSAVGLLIIALMPWLLEFHYPAVDFPPYLGALRNPAWKREGLVDPVEYSIRHKDYVSGGSLLLPHDARLSSGGDSFRYLREKCPALQQVEHAELGIARRYERRTR